MLLSGGDSNLDLEGWVGVSGAFSRLASRCFRFFFFLLEAPCSGSTCFRFFDLRGNLHSASRKGDSSGSIGTLKPGDTSKVAHGS